MARKKKTENHNLLAEDCKRAKELGMSYGEYIAYKERRELTIALVNKRRERQRLKSVDSVEWSYIGGSKFTRKGKKPHNETNGINGI